MTRLKNHIHKDTAPRAKEMLVSATNQYKQLDMSNPRVRKQNFYAKHKTNYKQLTRGWCKNQPDQESAHHAVYKLEKSRIVVCKDMSFAQEVERLSGPGKRKAIEERVATTRLQDWYLPISCQFKEEKAVLLLDRDFVHFATIQWRPPQEDDAFNKALQQWSSNADAIASMRNFNSFSEPGALSRSMGQYRTSHFRFRGLGSQCHAYAPNWDAKFFHNRKLLAPLVFGDAAEVIRHRISNCLATAHLPLYRKLEQWHRDGYVRTHPFPADWTTDKKIQKRVEDAGSGLWKPYGGYAMKWPTQAAACKPHVDSGEELLSPCTVMPFGIFEGGGLVLDQAAVILDLRQGDLGTFPASAIFHYNTPIVQGHRGSIVNHIQGSLTRLKKGVLGEPMFAIDNYKKLCCDE
ncbi:hypothetical protein CBS101457_000149 [Exobasidium rhododendri]|nr:hypothetical protein CBS101457_000149 [Exobasidium rhododendri]